MKLNFNALIKGDNAVVEYIIRDYRGKFLKGGVINLREVTVIMVEVIFLRYGVK